MSEPDPGARRARIPKLRLHKPSGLGVVTLAGRDVYLGKHGTRECRAAYRKALARWLADGSPAQRAPEAEALTITELVAAWWPVLEKRHAQQPRWLNTYRVTLRLLVKLFGDERAAEFGPRKLTTYRAGLLREVCRTETNRRVQIVRRMFRWGVAQELLPATTAHALDACEHVQPGEGGREGRKVAPVAREHVEAVLPHVSREVAALVELQWWTGARSGELVELRLAELDRSGAVWIYRPSHHKTERHGHVRAIALGPKAQAVLRPFVERVPPPAPKEHLLSPARAEAMRAIERRQARRSPLTPSQRKRRRKSKPAVAPGMVYDSGSYARAVSRGVDAENAERLRAAMRAAVPEHTAAIQRLPVLALIDKKHAAAVDAERLVRACSGDLAAQQRALRAIEGVALVPHWHPHQLRHACATRLRAELGVEAARVVLGHSSLDATAIYAEANRAAAAAAMERVG